MAKQKHPKSWITENRRGCLVFAVLLALVIAALAYVGFQSSPINDVNSAIPTLGALFGGVRPASAAITASR
jgi:hypothetical protein